MITQTNHRIEPFYPIHPGEIIKDEIEFRNISQKQFSKQIGISYTMLNEILNGKRVVNTDFALRVEAALDINPETLLNMQTRYNIQVARSNKEYQSIWESIRKICAAVL